MSNFLDTGASLLTSWTGVASICGLILLFFFVCSVMFGFQYWPLKGRLKRLVEHLESLSKPGGLAVEFEAFNERVSEDPVLSHPWEEYRETLIVEPGPPPRIWNSEPAGDYFSLESLGSHLNLRFYNAVPNILTGFGILGTFLGLVAGLYLAQKGLVSDDIDEMKASLSGLLAGASLAFLTSVVGILTSLIYSVFEKSRVHRLRIWISRWITALDGRLDRVTSESLGRDALVEQRKQSAMLERFNTELALNIAQALDSKVTERLVPHLDRLVGAVEGLRAEQSTSLRTALEQLVEGITSRFERSFSDATGSELKGLASGLDEVGRQMSTSADSLANSQREFAGSLSSFQEDLRKSLTGVTDTLQMERAKTDQALQEHLAKMAEASNRVGGEMSGRFDAAGSRLSGLVDELTGFVQQMHSSNREASQEMASVLTATAGALGKAADRLKESAAQLPAVLESVGGTLGSLQPVATGLEISSKRFESAGSRLERFIEVMSSAQSAIQRAEVGFGEALRAIREEREGLAAGFQEYQSRFAGVDQSAQSLFREVNMGIDSYTAKIADFHREVERQLGQSLLSLNATIADFKELLEDLEETLSKDR